VHLIEVTPGDRAVLARFTWLPPGGPVRVVAAHLHTPKARSFAKRQAELAALRKEMNHTGTPAVVLGDLNTTPWAPDYRDLLTGTTWKDARRGRGVLPTRRHITHPLFGSWLRPLGECLAVPIDHVFTTPDLPVTELRTGQDVGSDHLPLVANLRQRPGTQ
jgi:endonuclease/exonuclease/phosphatase family metal-dependent hydrolase